MRGLGGILGMKTVFARFELDMVSIFYDEIEFKIMSYNLFVMTSSISLPFVKPIRARHELMAKSRKVNSDAQYQ